MRADSTWPSFIIVSYCLVSSTTAHEVLYQFGTLLIKTPNRQQKCFAMNSSAGTMLSNSLRRRGLLSLRTATSTNSSHHPQENRLPLPLPLASGNNGAIHPVQTRQMSSYVLDGILGRRGGGSAWQWPVTKPNTIFNIVPQGHRCVC